MLLDLWQVHKASSVPAEKVTSCLSVVVQFILTKAFQNFRPFSFTHCTLVQLNPPAFAQISPLNVYPM